MKKRQTKSRLTAYLLIIIMVCFGILGMSIYYYISNMMIKQNKQYGMEVAKMAAHDIDGDSYARISSVDSKEYTEVYEVLARYREYDMIKYIYTMNMDGNVVRFIVDTDPDDPAYYGEEYQFEDEMVKAFSGETSCDKKVTNDRWGSYYSSYSPIFTSDGQVVGIVGCDIDINEITGYLDKVKSILVKLISHIVVICFVIYIVFARKYADRDMLTGIGNIEKLNKISDKLWKRDKLKDYSGILINIKDFKYLNKRIGTANGDNVLRGYAKALVSRKKAKETVVRTGNDNFFALIKKGRENEFLEGINGVSIHVAAIDEDVIINVRCGVYEIDEKDDIGEVINRCSVALRATRESDAADIKWFKNEMYEKLMRDKRVISSFRRGIQNCEFAVYYQPKVDIIKNELCGAEALVRWIKDGQVVPPDRFIPVLEETGDIIELDFYVFDRVCQNIAEWKKQGIKPVRVSSNFSKLHLKNPDFSSRIIEIADKYDVEYELLDIELTESTGYSELDALSDFVTVMKSHSIFVSMDDFGTGYSSLSMLNDVDCNVIKIDKSFFYKLEDSESRTGKMLENMIHMLSDMDKHVICEGVETIEQVNFLRNTDCHIVQGYYFDKPLPTHDFVRKLNNPLYVV